MYVNSKMMFISMCVSSIHYYYCHLYVYYEHANEQAHRAHACPHASARANGS